MSFGIAKALGTDEGKSGVEESRESGDHNSGREE